MSFRPALSQINDFDEAGLVALDCAFGIKEPKQGDDRQREKYKFPCFHSLPFIMSSEVETSLAIVSKRFVIMLTINQRFLDFARNDKSHRVRGRHAAATETNTGLLDFARNDGINRN